MIDPRNPDIALAAALGHAYGPSRSEDCFTTDGGKTWQRVLFTDENTGCSDLVMDPSNPRIVFAGHVAAGDCTGVEAVGLAAVSSNPPMAGAWKKRLAADYPRTTGKFALAIARSNPNRIYALIETGDGVP